MYKISSCTACFGNVPIMRYKNEAKMIFSFGLLRIIIQRIRNFCRFAAKLIKDCKSLMDKIRDYENNLEQEEYIYTFAVQQSNRKRTALQVNIC